MGVLPVCVHSLACVSSGERFSLQRSFYGRFAISTSSGGSMKLLDYFVSICRTCSCASCVGCTLMLLTVVICVHLYLVSSAVSPPQWEGFARYVDPERADFGTVDISYDASDQRVRFIERITIVNTTRPVVDYFEQIFLHKEVSNSNCEVVLFYTLF